jgi:hypothetical protein
LGASHVCKGAIREDSHPTISIRIKRLINIISWILGTILCLADRIPVNHEYFFRFHHKEVIVVPDGAGAPIPCIPKIKRGLIPNINPCPTTGVFVG